MTFYTGERPRALWALLFQMIYKDLNNKIIHVLLMRASSAKPQGHEFLIHHTG